MSWKNKSLFFKKDENTTIHYKLNFNPKKIKKNELVLVFNYGLICNFNHFKYQIDYFHYQGYNILFHDYRCHFTSHSKEGIKSCNFKNMSHDVKSLLDHLNISKTIMISHSMGVNVSFEFAKDYPEYIISMVLISGTVFPPQDVMFNSNLVDLAEPLIDVTKSLLGKTFSLFWKNIYKNPLIQLVTWHGGFNMKQTEISFVKDYLKHSGELGDELFFHLFSEMKYHDIIGHLNQIEGPCLIIGGDKDKIIPNYLQRLLNNHLKNSSLYIVKDGSHVPQVDFPENINNRIKLFIQQTIP